MLKNGIFFTTSAVDALMSFKVLNEYTFKFIIFNMNYKINQLKKGIQVSLLATTKFAK